MKENSGSQDGRTLLQTGDSPVGGWAGSADAVVDLPLHRIVLPAWANGTIDPEVLSAFEGAIRLGGGLLHPITVRPLDGDPIRHELVAGRLRLASALQMGETTIACRIRRLSDEQTAAVSLLENVARRQRPQLVQGRAILRALDSTGWSQADLARVTAPLGGWNEGQISELRRAAETLPPDVVSAAAAAAGVPSEQLETALTRDALRLLLKMEEGELLASVGRAAEAVDQGASVLAAIRGGVRRAEVRALGGGALKLES